MNVMAAICNSFSGRRSFASLTRSPGLNKRAPVEEAVVFPSMLEDVKIFIAIVGLFSMVFSGGSVAVCNIQLTPLPCFSLQNLALKHSLIFIASLEVSLTLSQFLIFRSSRTSSLGLFFFGALIKD